MKNKKGVTLIILVITIIVIIILASTIVLSLSSTDILNKGKKDEYIGEVVTYQDSLKLYHSNMSLKLSHNYNANDINADGKEMKKYIKEMKEEDYDKFKIKQGELVYIGQNDNEIKWSSGIIKVEELNFKLEATPTTKDVEILVEISGRKANEQEKEFIITLIEDKRSSLDNNINNDSKDIKKQIVKTNGLTNKNKISCNFKDLKHGVVYLVTAQVNIDGKTYKTNKNEEIYTAIDMESEVPNAPVIKWDKEYTNTNPIADITLKDNDLGSGIKEKSCKYIFDSNSENYVSNDNIWKDNSKAFNFINITSGENGEKKIRLKLEKPIDGKYYLHVLSVDNFDNKVTGTSIPVTIDSTAPELNDLVIDINPKNYTNKDIEVIIKGLPKDAISKKYTSPDSTIEKDCENNTKFTVSKNGFVTVKVEDEAGNISSKRVEIKNIDKLSPNVTLSPNYNSNPSKSVTVKVSAYDIEGTNEYCKSDIESIKYQWRTSNAKVSESDNNWIVMSNNASLTLNNKNGLMYLHVLVKDKAGNIKNYVSGSYNMDNTAPSTSKISVLLNPNDYTNQNVKATINGISSDAVIKQYKSPDQTQWKDCNNGTQIDVSKNGTINIRVVDAAGNEDTKVFSVDKIDKLIPIVKLDPNYNISFNKSVTVKISANDPQGNNEYCKSDIESIKYQWSNTYDKINNNDSNWKNVNNNTSVTINNITGDRFLHVLVKDRAGNILNYTSGKYIIDNTAPSISSLNISINPTTFARKTMATITGKPADAESIEYTLPGSNTWLKYNGNFEVTKNGKIRARLKDVAGNISAIKELNVTNIDKLEPTSITLSPNSVNNAKLVLITVNATDAVATNEDASSGIEKIKYQFKTNNNPLSINDVSWNNAESINSNAGYLNINTITGIRYLHVLAIDKAGNKKSMVSGAYSIDNTPPSVTNLSISINPTTYTRQATATISGKTSEMKYIEYTLPGETTYNKYTGNFIVTKNGVIKFRAEDYAGNTSAIKEYNVTNIDRESPSVPIITNTSNGNVTKNSISVTLLSKDNLSGILKYQWFDDSINSWKDINVNSSDGKGYITFTNTINKNIRFRAIDKASNISGESSSIVNIDKNKPFIEITNILTGTRSLEVKVRASDSESGLPSSPVYKYYVKKKTDLNFPTNPVYQGSNTSAILDGLIHNTEYVVKVTVKDNVGNEGEAISTGIVKTKQIPSATNGVINIGSVIWNKDTHNASVKLSTNTGLNIQYQINSTTGSWLPVNGQRLNITVNNLLHNNIVYARLFDGINYGAYTSLTVLDQINPEIPIVSNLPSEMNAKQSKNVTVEIIDNQSGIDLNASKWVFNADSTDVISKNLYTNSFTKNINSISISSAKGGIYYLHVLSVDKAGRELQRKFGPVKVKNPNIPNPPILAPEMTPIKWVNGVEQPTDENDKDWYDYDQSKWANAKTPDGSYWVWIPRYAYQIRSGNYNTVTPGLINIKFLRGTTNTASDGTNTWDNRSGADNWNIHPVFRNNPNIGGWDSELTGFWVAKFEADRAYGIVSCKPGVEAHWPNIKINDFFNTCRKSDFGGTTSIDSHMMKNTEWGAVAYLSQSEYGSKDIRITCNTTYYAGGGNTPTAYLENKAQSTTQNEYGIYDMVGGNQDYLAAYIDNAKANNGEDFGTLIGAHMKYKNVYKPASVDDRINNFNFNKDIYGDAMFETSTVDRLAWYNVRSNYFYSSSTKLIRGGWHVFDESCSIFAYDTTGGRSSGDTCRPCLVVNIEPDKSGVANRPVLASGMTPIKWVNNVEQTTTANDPDWYDYAHKKWANAKTSDGSYWVWIPRYAYKIPRGNYHSNQEGIVDIRFLRGTSNVASYDGTSNWQNRTGADNWNIHPAFTSNTSLGGWDRELPGIWVAKFEASRSNATSTSDGTSNVLKIVPTVRSWRNITINDMFIRARDYNTTLNSHLMKNSEWGAVAYLTASKAGKSGEVWLNGNSNYLTGSAPDQFIGQSANTLKWNDERGGLASTTGNITGIYDMSGGSWECMAAYVNNSYARSKLGALYSAPAKMKNVYKRGGSENSLNNYNANSSVYGDAIYETSSNVGSISQTGGDYIGYGWYEDATDYPYGRDMLFTRGGGITARHMGEFFFFNIHDGATHNGYGFRPVLICP